MEDGSVEAIFEAITAGDQQALARCMDSATIGTILEFEALYGESPLHLCVKLGGMSHIGLVRYLLASRLLDFDQRDGEGQTVLEYAYTNGESELVKELIKVEIESLDDVTACYRMMKHNSLDLFKMFLCMTQPNEEDVFKSIGSALVMLNVKNFVLSEDLRVFVLWKLSDYGYRNLTGNWAGTKEVNEWKGQFDVIADCWRVISVEYDTRMYGDIDDQLLHRLHVIHNYMYFLKHKPFLNHLPMHEVVFCLAMFISIFKNRSQFEVYRLVINKCLVMDFVRMVHRQLELIKVYLEMVEKELVVIMKENQEFDAQSKGRLLGEIFENIKTLNIANKDYWIEEATKKMDASRFSNKNALIKEMMRKIKTSDKDQWTKAVQTIDETNKLRLINEIRKRLPHASHPQNVANRLIAGLKKDKNVETIVAEIVGEESFNLKHLLRGRDRRIMRKVKKCYGKTKQFYSLHKVLFYCGQIPEGELGNPVALVSCMKRMIQVFGESVKNTQHSPNMPGKAERVVGTFLTDLFPEMNKSLREIISHSVSLKNILIGEAHEKLLSLTVTEHMPTVIIAFQLLYVVMVADIRQSLYGVMLRCGSIEAQRSLLFYVGDTKHLEKTQYECYMDVKKYFNDAQNLFAELRDSTVAKTAEFIYLQKQFKIKCDIVVQLDKFFEENDGLSYDEIRRACFAGGDLAAVRRMSRWKLTMRWANKFYSNVHSAWNTGHIESMSIQCMDPRIMKFNPCVIAGVLKKGTVAMDCAEEFDYIVHTRQLTRNLGIDDGIDEEALQELNKRLKPYYDNIFLVDNKWKIVTAFCNACELHVQKSVVSELMKRDQDQLEILFNDRRRKLRSILEQHGLSTVDNLVQFLYNLPPHAMKAMEHLQLELSEMLAAVGYFGDSFHYIKHRIPMIQGKNYRNYLAHDPLSYNLLTDSSMEKVVINAYVFANTEVRLFAKTVGKTVDITMSFPSVEDTHRWNEEQTQMIRALRSKDFKQILEAKQNGGEIKSLFCCSPNERYSSMLCHLTTLVDPCDPATEIMHYMDKYFEGFSDKCREPAHQLKTALRMGNFKTAFDRSIGQGDKVIPEELFSWPELIPNVRQTDMYVHLVAVINRHRILKKLIEHGNEQGVRDMLPYFEDFSDSQGRGFLGDALLYNVRSIAELLIDKTSVPHVAAILLAIIKHWNDILAQILKKSEIDGNLFSFLLITAAQAENYTAAALLLNEKAFKQYIPAAFTASCKRAAEQGQEAMLQHLLESYPSSKPAILAEIMHSAALRKRWKCVSMLLDRHAPVDVLFPANHARKSSTLLVLIQYGLSRLLDRVKSVNCSIYGGKVPHPIAVAICHNMASPRMIRALRHLGFDWLDSSMILHEAIEKYDKVALATIWQQVDTFSSNPLIYEDSHFIQGVAVLKRWQMIGFVEESTTNDTALIVAVRNKYRELVTELLDRAKRMRQLEGIGVLSSIVFQVGSLHVRFGERYDGINWNVEKSCHTMIIRLKSFAMLDMCWQQFTIDTGVRVKFSVLSAIGETIEVSSHRTDIRKSGSLVESLIDLVAASHELFGETLVVTAHFMLSDGSMRYFWKIEEVSCAYDVLPPGSHIDLSDTVNYRDLRGETALHKCFPRDDLPMVQQLVEAGANPLLADESAMAAIHLSLLNSKDYAVGRYLFDVCVQYDLRNDKGICLLDLDDGNGGNRLIHTAVMTGRRDIVHRLLKLHVDVSVINTVGLTPAQLAIGSALQNPILKELLDYDSTVINLIDGMGNTMLHYAAQLNSIELLHEILRHGPDLAVPCRFTALGTAILLKNTKWAKCLLDYAIEKSIRGITSIDDGDLVLFSLICNDFNFSKALLEYELEHSLDEIDSNDLARIESMLNSSIATDSCIPIWQFVRVKGLTESEDFLTYLNGLCNSLKER